MPSVKEIYHKIDDVRIEADSINLNVDGLEALASTQQADVAAIKADLADGIPVSVSSSTLPSGAATSANQTTANTSLSNIDTDIGALADSAASTDTGSFSLISLFKRLLSTKLPDQSSGRIPVTLASAGTTGSTAPTNANLVGGTDGTNLRGIRTDTSGRVSTQIFDSSGTALTYAGTGTAGTPSSDVVTVQGVGGMTALTVAQTTASSLNATVVQSTATNLKTQAEAYQGGTAVGSANPLQVTLANTASNSTAVNIAPRNGAVTVTAGTTSGTANTSAQALASSSTRRYLLIQNISDTDMYFNFGAAATTSHLLLKSGGAGITFETGFVPTDAVNVICSAASKSYYILSA